MSAFLDLVASKQIDVESLITERVPVEQAAEAYERLVGAERFAARHRAGVRSGARAWASTAALIRYFEAVRPPWWA